MIKLLHLPTGEVGLVPESTYIPTVTSDLKSFIHYICCSSRCGTRNCDTCPWSTNYPKTIEQFEITKHND